MADPYPRAARTIAVIEVALIESLCVYQGLGYTCFIHIILFNLSVLCEIDTIIIPVL